MQVAAGSGMPDPDSGSGTLSYLTEWKLPDPEPVI